MRSLKVTLHVLILAGMIFLAVGLAAARDPAPAGPGDLHHQERGLRLPNSRYRAADAAVDHVFAGPRANCSNVSTTPRSTRQPCLYRGVPPEHAPRPALSGRRETLLWSSLGMSLKKRFRKNLTNSAAKPQNQSWIFP